MYVEDQRFLDIMDPIMERDENHNWIPPLPLKHSGYF